jgi:outer membrane murein-binding lipoprotein Lpp
MGGVPDLRFLPRQEGSVKLLKGIVLGSVLLSAGHAAAEEDTSSEIRMLKTKLKQLEERVDSKVARVTAASPVPYTKVPTVACPDGKICYKGVTLTLGGWVDLTDIYRTRSLASDVGSVYNSIPFRNNGGYGVQENKFSARTSRFSLLAEGDANPATHFAGYGEFDFESAGSTSNTVATNSFTLRMRQLSLNIDRKDIGFHVLAGQTWSLNAPSKSGIDPRGIDAPGVIDFENVPGLMAARLPGIRLTQELGPGVQIAVAAENAQTSFFGGDGANQGNLGNGVAQNGINNGFTGATATTAAAFNSGILLGQTSPGGGFFNPLTNVSLNRVPDVTAKIAFDPNFGGNRFHFEAWGTYREFYDQVTPTSGAGFGTSHSNTTTSFAYGAHINMDLVPKTLELQASVSNGAQGRYSASPLPDATLRQDGTIQALPIFSAQAGLIWHTTPLLDLYSYYGLEQTKATFSNSAGGAFGYGNPLYNNTGCNTPGSATCNGNTSKVQQFTAGYFYTLYQGRFGAVKLGTQYSYTQRFAFEGVGGAPKTDDHIIMSNFRYYPF